MIFFQKALRRKDFSNKALLYLQALKILLPHVGLTVLLLGYLASGAVMLMWMEQQKEVEKRNDKVFKVTQIHELIVNVSVQLCQKNSPYDVGIVSTRMKKLLNLLSEMNEYDERFDDEHQPWDDDRAQMSIRWTFAAAVLYSLTVITTTGYDHVTPLTNGGRIFTVIFGLVGIPLMFITAADIGKFLSTMVTYVHKKVILFGRYAGQKLPFMQNAHMARIRNDKNSSILPVHLNDIDLQLFTQEESELPVELPIVAYFMLILSYCAVGSALFTSYERGSLWTFVYGFFFSFNAITTIGLGNIKVQNNVYLVLIVVYTIIGLSLITMCIDLASAQLKLLFTKLHYFGRKFRGARVTVLNMSDDIKEAIRIIAALRKFHPSKEKFTVEDIRRYLEIERQFLLKPFVPENMNYIQWADDDSYTSTLSLNLLPHLQGTSQYSCSAKCEIENPVLDKNAQF